MLPSTCEFLAGKHDKVWVGNWHEDEGVSEGPGEVTAGSDTRKGFRARGFGGRGA